MTMYTPLGDHHSKVRACKFDPVIRGGDYARGKSPLVVSPRDERSLRRLDRVKNTLSRRYAVRQWLFAEASTYGQY